MSFFRQIKTAKIWSSMSEFIIIYLFWITPGDYSDVDSSLITAFIRSAENIQQQHGVFNWSVVKVIWNWNYFTTHYIDYGQYHTVSATYTTLLLRLFVRLSSSIFVSTGKETFDMAVTGYPSMPSVVIPFPSHAALLQIPQKNSLPLLCSRSTPVFPRIGYMHRNVLSTSISGRCRIRSVLFSLANTMRLTGSDTVLCIERRKQAATKLKRSMEFIFN